jgi:hypothetical protein
MPARPSRGFKFAIPMLIFMIMEIGVFIDAWLVGSRINKYVVWYFALKIVLCLVQATGIWLVARGAYQAGGTLQIAASAVHLVELVGLVGIYGGLQAYRYPERLTEQVAASGPAVPVSS